MTEDRQWRISKEEYKKLLSFIGYGNFPKAKILFFGIEEGTGGYEIEANVVARVTTFGEFDDKWNLISAIAPPDWSSGYWEPWDGERKIREYIEQRDGITLSPKNFVRSFFLQTIARMCLELETPNEDPYYWWKPYKDNHEAENKIKQFILEELFRTRQEGIQTALTDWKPLPRPNMSVWPNEYQPLNKRLYNDAFDKFIEGQDDFSNYLENALFRRSIIQQMIGKFKIPVLISFGQIDVKKSLLTHILPNVSFSSLSSNVFPQSPAVQAHTDLEGHPLNVFLLPFPSSYTSVWANRSVDQPAGVFMLDFFREFTQTYLIPIMDNNKR